MFLWIILRVSRDESFNAVLDSTLKLDAIFKILVGRCKRSIDDGFVQWRNRDQPSESSHFVSFVVIGHSYTYKARRSITYCQEGTQSVGVVEAVMFVVSTARTTSPGLGISDSAYFKPDDAPRETFSGASLIVP